MRVPAFGLTAGLIIGLASSMANEAAADPTPSLFKTAEIRAGSHAALPKWQRVLRGIERERGTVERCGHDRAACSSRGMMAWNALLDGLDGAPLHTQVRAVNRFVNQWDYRSDIKNFGRSDYWATPAEFFLRSGDCEDYAITKYVSLRRLGVPSSELRLVVLQDTLRDIAHAVLSVRLDDEWVVLDNLSNAVLSDERLPHYVPYYSINEDARWAHVSPVNKLVSSIDSNVLKFGSAAGRR